MSHRLAALLGLPLTHLDKLHWKPGWVEGTKEELLAALAPIITQDRWLIDGNYGSTMEMRLSRADTVVYLDYPIRLCLWRAAQRVWSLRGRTRPDMGEGCPERFDWAFFRYIAGWNHHARPRTEGLLRGTDARILRFETPQALDAWLAELERDR
ncbi:topology modulation protein [Erythrobacter litoralis]|uniref:topology modulation protein n=1 Tax=Erythrobacter litoralis TaxID=39960 RepID=UPI000311C259|nr:topology modulation protein [Erythrobacter litoralis]